MNKNTKRIVLIALAAVFIGIYVYTQQADVDFNDVPNNVKKVVNQVADGEKADDMEEDNFSEYTLNVDIVSKDAMGNEYAVKTTMYKKGDKALYEIDEMTGPEELPFKPLKNLMVGTDLYTYIEVGDEAMWFKAEGVEQQADAMFDLEDMQAELLNSEEVEETKEEEIEGETMTCYYMKEQAGKACLKDGIFAYGEDVDPVSGMESVIRVTNYTKSVDDSVFAVPSADEVKDMNEFMALMMEQAEGLVPAEPLPVDPAAEEEGMVDAVADTAAAIIDEAEDAVEEVVEAGEEVVEEVAEEMDGDDQEQADGEPQPTVDPAPAE